MINRESGHFGVVNGEVTTVVDPVLCGTPRKSSTNDTQMKKVFSAPPPPLKILSYEDVSRRCQCTTSKTASKVPRQTVGMKDNTGTDQTREQDLDFEQCY